MYEDEEDNARSANFEIPWLGFVDVTSATLASIMVLVMVFGLSAAVTMAEIERSERELYRSGLIYPFDEFRDYEIRPFNGWSRGEGQELIYKGEWGVPVLDNGGGGFINNEVGEWNTDGISLEMIIEFNPEYIFHGAALELGYEQINEIRKAVTNLDVNINSTMDVKILNDRKVGTFFISLKPVR